MQITPTGRGTYEVVGGSGEPPYTVDLLAYLGSGRCDCWGFVRHYKRRIEDDIAAGTFTPSPAYKCLHIQACDHELLMLFKRELMKQFPDQEQTV